MSKKHSKNTKKFIFTQLVVLPYGHLVENTPKRGRVSEDCLRQSLHIVERRLKIE
jgi:hypothetical protein